MGGGGGGVLFFLMIRLPPRSTQSRSSAASDVYKRQIEHRAIEEMKHAEMLMERLLFLEGKPILSELNKLHVGDAVDVQFQFDHESEIGAVKLYNDGIRLAVEVGDNGTRELFETILKDEENHVDWLESQLDQIDQMGLPNYLTEQVG